MKAPGGRPAVDLRDMNLRRADVIAYQGAGTTNGGQGMPDVLAVTKQRERAKVG